MGATKNLVHDLLHLFFPHTCQGCGSDLISEGQLLCFSCNHQLPFTSFELYPNNPVEKIFWGRVQIQNAMSLFYFSKDSMMQNLMHQFKYKSKKEIGLYFGKMMGKVLMQTNRFCDIEALVPLPLFASKEKIRGFNQSTILCDGLAETMRIPVIKDAIIRTTDTETQTHKSRIERWQNIKGKFLLKDEARIKNRHVLLVDDVITTGATLEACATELLKAENTKVSIATLAFALR
ncbi:MAG: ComF family protein [Bacteroidetes bacterium]|nr:ComF family protein [Bacteroidota bacterium]